MNNQIMIAYLIEKLELTEDYLANYLGVTPVTLNNWKRLNYDETSEKSIRLKRLFQTVRLITLETEYAASEIKNILDNNRVVFDSTNLDEGSISLIGYINSQVGEISKKLIQTLIKG